MQTRQEQITARANNQEVDFNRVIINHPYHIRHIEGLRIKEVFLTPDVLTEGLNSHLFDRLASTLVSMSVDPTYAFRIFYIREEYHGNNTEDCVLPAL